MRSSKFLKNVCNCMAINRQLHSSSRRIEQNAKRQYSAAVKVKTDPEPQKEPQKTGLYDLHVQYGGKMVNFAGYYLPVQYEGASIGSSHLHTRSNCSLFDVSHMMQTKVYGKDSIEFLESLCVSDIQGMKKEQSVLSLFTNDETGGIIDDFIVTKVSKEDLFLVSNASRKSNVKKLLSEKLDEFAANGKKVFLEFFDSQQQSLVALQGPQTANILQPFVNINLDELYFMNGAVATVCGIENCRITRCGYTGEDGVEISIPTSYAIDIVHSLLQCEQLQLAGLGARDTLRLEAGLCLHGNDIDEDTTPIEAGLAWTIGKRRREEKNFPGSTLIMEQISQGVSRKRVGVVKIGGPPARPGTVIVGFDDEVIGQVTSGCPSPSLGVNIAMGYVKPSYAKSKTELRLKIRDRLYDASVSKMPFVPAKYYSPKK